jgi:hypothetical protein
MKKLNTLFKKDPSNLGRVIHEINTIHDWVFTNQGIATRKFDGTSCAIINGELYKRFDLKPGRQLPENAIACQEADSITAHHPHWIKCDRSDNANKWHFEGFDKLVLKEEGTFELCGPKVQGNPEKIGGHELIKHGAVKLEIKELSFEGIKQFLTENDIEGIVFHHKTNEMMCKIRKTDFGIKR